jgi:hypothetical protein
MSEQGINQVITHHNLETLSDNYVKVKSYNRDRQRILNSDNVLAVLNSLGINPISIN